MKSLRNKLNILNLTFIHANFYFFVFLLSDSSFAAYSNYNSILIGDQAAGLGGAYTALTKDASALSWYNPATLAMLEGQSFSAAVGIYKKFDTTFGKKEDFSTAAMRANLGFFRAIPSSTGSVVRFREFFPDYTFALSIIVPEYDSFKGDVHKTESLQSSINFTDESLWVGTGIGKKISEKSSLGLTIYYVSRSYSKSVSSRAKISDTQMKIYSEEKDFKQNGVALVFGYYSSIDEFWRWGVSFRPPVFSLGGTGSYFEYQADSGILNSSHTFEALSAPTHVPSKTSIGVACEWRGLGLLTMDVSYYGADSYLDVDSEIAAVKIEHQSITNISLGGEFSFFPWMKFRGGLFTNYSSHPSPAPDKSRGGQSDRVDQFGFSANAALLSGGIEYTFGGYYSGGSGDSIQRTNEMSSNPYEKVSKTQQVFTMLVGTSYSF